ncbi:MAG: pSer/pThr/pTyr-binding forkhead associated (FHA) protein [Flavobacteriales bacterium]|jgi:pSer/pThr/pTyr-binding forkhead associated (FHA) protein
MSNSYTLKHLKDQRELPIPELSSLVGRSANCDIQIDETSLSREHARITIRDEIIQVQDLHSTNGTFINEEAISGICPLRAGDILRFGQERFSLQLNNSDATVMFAHTLSESAMMIEDEDEADGTVMLQSISLPSGWVSDDDFSSDVPQSEHQDHKLIIALQAHASNKLKYKYGLIVTVKPEQSIPQVKLLSTQGESSEWFIGRDTSCALHLDESRISHKHARVFFQNKQWKLEDCDSRNGVLKNGQIIKACQLSDTPSLEFGPYTLDFKIIDQK